jgi:hypothetical protein
MNYVLGMLLIELESEENAFWIMVPSLPPCSSGSIGGLAELTCSAEQVAIVDDLFSDFYNADLSGTQVLPSL